MLVRVLALFGMTFGMTHTALAEDVVPRMVVDFPYPVVSVPGENALATWRALTDGTQTPIILGSDDDFQRVRDGMQNRWAGSPDDILKRATEIAFPADLITRFNAEQMRLIESLTAMGIDPLPPVVLELPEGGLLGATGTPSGGERRIARNLSSTKDILTGQYLPLVHIAVLPTSDPSEAPAYLQFGGWNANPEPSMHVAALKYWRDIYGATPIAMTGDVMEVIVTQSPKRPADAERLATEQYAFAPDIVDQGTGDARALMRTLAQSPTWFFWWD